MKYEVVTKEKAVKLRKKGWSYSEIVKECGIAQSTASVWLRGIRLGREASQRIEQRREKGRLSAKITKRNQKEGRLKRINNWSEGFWKNRVLKKEDWQIIGSLLYWGEGAKFSNRVEFTNSDPEMIRTFIDSLVWGFEINTEKIKVNMHLHEYHNEVTQRAFWSKVTGISELRFSKSYIKPNSGKILRNEYPGCIRVCYHSKDLVDRLKAVYRQLAKIRP